MITTQMLCLEDGGRGPAGLRRQSDSNYHLSLVFRYLDTFPSPPGCPSGPRSCPAMTPEQIDKTSRAGYIAVGEPRRGGNAPSSASADTGADQLSFGMLSSSMPIETVRGGRGAPSASTCWRSSTRTPCTARPRSAWPRSAPESQPTASGHVGPRRRGGSAWVTGKNISWAAEVGQEIAA